jgi:hypothetical protein
VQDGAKDLEQLMNSRTVYLAKQDECMKKIRDLGSLPADAFEAYVSVFLKLLNCVTQSHNTCLSRIHMYSADKEGGTLIIC